MASADPARTAEVTVAALEDLAEARLEAGDPDGAQALLIEAAGLPVATDGDHARRRDRAQRRR